MVVAFAFYHETIKILKAVTLMLAHVLDKWLLVSSCARAGNGVMVIPLQMTSIFVLITDKNW